MAFVGRLFGAGRRPEPQPLRLSLRTDEARKLIIGRAGTAGAFGFHGVSPRPAIFDRNNNDFLHQVILLAGHRCNRLTRVWGDGELVMSRPLQHGVETEIPNYRDGRRARLWLTYFDGRPNQTANPVMTGSNIRPVRWGANDRLRGMAYVSVRAQFDRDVLTSPPDFIFEVEGAPLYDRRKDSSAGGSGTQRWGNPSTWVYTDNPAVAADHYQLGMVGGAANEELIFGMGLEPWQVPFSEFQANADLCDERVDVGRFGSQTRYAANGVLSAEADHRDNIRALATAMAAQPFDTGGQIIIRPQQARPVVMTLTDEDLVDGARYELDPTPSGTDLVNTVRGTYREPASRHNEEDYPRVEDAEQVSQDGRPFEHTLDLVLETNAMRAQRLASIELEVQKRRDQLTETFMPIANRLKVGDWFERVSNLRGPVSKIYEVESKVTRDDLTVEITGRETDPSVVAFSADQVRPVVLPDPIPPLPAQRPPAPDFTPTPTEREGGGTAGPVVVIEVAPDEEEEEFTAVDFFEVQFGLSNGLLGNDLGIASGQAQILRFNASDTRFEITGLMPATDYVYRIRAVRNGITGDFGPFIGITTTENLVVTSARGAVPGSNLDRDIKTAAAAAGQAAAAAASAREIAQGALDGAETVAGELGQTNVQVAAALEANANEEQARLQQIAAIRSSFAQRGVLLNGSFEEGEIGAGAPLNWPLSTQNAAGISTVIGSGEFASQQVVHVTSTAGVNTSFRQSATVTPEAFYDLEYTLEQISGDGTGSGVLLVWRAADITQVQPTHRSRIRLIPDTEGEISVSKLGVRTFYERVQVPPGAVRCDILVGSSASLGSVRESVTEYHNVSFKPSGGSESLAVTVTESLANEVQASVDRDNVLAADLGDAEALLFETQEGLAAAELAFAQDIEGIEVSLQDAETRRLLSTFPTDWSDRENWSSRNVGRPEDKITDAASLYLDVSPNGFGQHYARTGGRSVYAKNIIPFDPARGLSWTVTGFVDVLDPNSNADNNLLAIALDEDLNVIGGRVFLVTRDPRARLRPSVRGRFTLRAELSPSDFEVIANDRPGVTYLVLGLEVNRGSSVARTELWTSSLEYSEGLARAFQVREAVINPDGSSVRQVIGGSVPGADVSVTLEAVNQGGEALGRVGLAADAITLFNRVAGVFAPALQVFNGVATFFGSLNALAGIFVGTGRWPVALEPQTYALRDGETVDFGYNFGAPTVLNYSTSALPALGSGEAYLVTFTGNDGSGFGISAKRATPGSPVERTRTNDAAGTGGLNRQMNAITAQEAFDGTYTFEFTTLVFVNGSGGGVQGIEGLVLDGFGFVNVEIFIHDGTAFRLVDTVTVSANSPDTGLRAVRQTFTVNYGGPVRNSGVAFGVAVTDTSDGQRVSRLHRVQYTTQNQSSVSSATAGGQRVIVTATPRNA